MLVSQWISETLSMSFQHLSQQGPDLVKIADFGLAREIRSRERREGKRYVHKIRDDDVVGRPRCLREKF